MSSITIHEYDDYAYYTGSSKVISEFESIPKRWTDVNLPEISEGQFARFWDGKWIVVDTPKPINIVSPDWRPGEGDIQTPNLEDVEQAEPTVI